MYQFFSVENFITCTIPNGSPFLPSHVFSSIPIVQVFCIKLKIYCFVRMCVSHHPLSLSLSLSLLYIDYSWLSFLIWEFFISASADSFFAEVETTVSLFKFLDSSQQYCSLDGLPLSSYFKSSNPCTHPLVTVPSVPITVSITVTFMFLSFMGSLAKSRYLYLFSPSFSITLLSTSTAKSIIRQVLFFSLFFLLLTSLGLVVWPRLNDPFLSQNPKEFCASHFLGRIPGCSYTICSYSQIYYYYYYYYCIQVFLTSFSW